MRGLLVVLEGIDGSGKTTLRSELARLLRARGHEVVETKEPTDGPLGKRIREVARQGRGTITAEEEFQLFHDDRRGHVDEIVRPALERGAIVLQDRSFHSTVAYQGDRGLDRTKLWAKSREIAPDPDVLLIIDVPPEISLERIRKREAPDAFETLEQLRRVRQVFLELDAPHKTLIDGTLSAAEVVDRALGAVLARLERRAP